MSWQFLTAISVATFSVSVILRRILLHKDKSDPIAYAVVFQGLVGLFVGLYAIYNGWALPNFSRYWFAITITSVLYALGNVYSAKALRDVEASTYSVIYASSAIWTILVGSWVLGDSITLLHVAGVGLVLFSVLMLNFKRGSISFNTGTVYTLVASAFFGLATVGWTYVARRADVPTWTALSFIVPAMLILLTNPRSVYKMKPLLKKRTLMTMLLLGAVYGVSALTSLFAYRNGNVNLVAALQQTAIIVTTVLAVIFLNERSHLKKKLLAAAVCLAGVLLIVR